MTGMEKYEALESKIDQLKNDCDTKDFGDVIFYTKLHYAIKFAAIKMTDETFDSFIKSLEV